jgi:hypothetical protein
MMKRFLATYWLGILVLVIALPGLWQDTHTIWSALSWIALIVQAVLLVLAVRLYRGRRTAAFAWLMWACVALVISQSSWFTFGFFAGLAGLDRESDAYATSVNWSEHVETAFGLAAFLLFVIAFNRFRSEHRAPAIEDI